jgi:hypothetical protein
MTRDKALALIDAPAEATPDQLLDLFEEAVFKQATFFLKRPFVVKQAQLKIQSLRALSEAAGVLEVAPGEAPFIQLTTPDTQPQGLEAILQTYHAEEKSFKYLLANATHPDVATQALERWVESFRNFAVAFIETMESIHKGTVVADNVRLTEQIDLMQVLSELKQGPDAWNEVLRLYSVLRRQMVSAS